MGEVQSSSKNVSCGGYFEFPRSWLIVSQLAGQVERQCLRVPESRERCWVYVGAVDDQSGNHMHQAALCDAVCGAVCDACSEAHRGSTAM